MLGTFLHIQIRGQEEQELRAAQTSIVTILVWAALSSCSLKCQSPGMQMSRNSNLQECQAPGLQICRYANLQICQSPATHSPGMPISGNTVLRKCQSPEMHISGNANLRNCKSPEVQISPRIETPLSKPEWKLPLPNANLNGELHSDRHYFICQRLI